MKDVDVHIGYDPSIVKARVLDAIQRAGAGVVKPQSHITFESWEGLSSALTGKRLELLRHVRNTPAASIADLARTLGRDYKRVHEDVGVLTTVGLLERSEAGAVRAVYDEIRTVISLTHAA